MRISTRVLLAVFTATALVVGMGTAASAKIVVGQSIKGVKLDMTKRQVIAKVGQPKSIKRGTGPFGRYQTLRYGKKLTVNITGGGVVLVRTRSAGQRTNRGIGVGSTRRQVKNRVPGVVCDTVAGFTSCHVNDFLPGEIVTVFRLRNRVVTAVEVGRVLD